MFADVIGAWIEAFDRISATQFRGDQRSWRHEDINFRNCVKVHNERLQKHRELLREWRCYSLEAQRLTNCRALWQRYLVKNARDVAEAVEKLKSLAQISALLAGFAVTAFYDFNYVAEPGSPLLPVFGGVTAITVGLELNCCMLCTMMLAEVVRVGKRYVAEQDEAEFLWRARAWSLARTPGPPPPPPAPPPPPPPAPQRSFQRHWTQRCEDVWRLSVVLFLLGVPFFFSLMAVAAYLKYLDSPETFVVAGVLMALGFLALFGMNYEWSKLLLAKSRDEGMQWGPALDARWQEPFGWHQLPDYTASDAANRASDPWFAMDEFGLPPRLVALQQECCLLESLRGPPPRVRPRQWPPSPQQQQEQEQQPGAEPALLASSRAAEPAILHVELAEARGQYCQ